MPHYPNPLFEQLFIVPETSFGVLAEPDGDHAIRHTRAALSFAQERANREDKHGSRGVRERVSRRKSVSYEIEGYAIPSDASGTEPDIHDLFSAHGLTAIKSEECVVADTPASTTLSCGVSPASAVAAGSAVGFVIDGHFYVRFIQSNTDGLIAWELPLPSAPEAGQTVYPATAYGPSAIPETSVSIWRYLDQAAFAYAGCVGESWEISMSAGNEVKMRFVGKGAGESHAVNDALTAAVSAETESFSVSVADRFAEGMILSVGSEQVKVTAAFPESDRIEVERGQGRTAPAAHAAGSTLSVYRPEPTVSGSPVAGIIGRVNLGGRSFEITEAALTFKEGLRLRETFGTDRPVGASYPERRNVQLSLTGFLTDETMKEYGMGKRFEPFSVDLQAGDVPGKTVFLHLNRFEPEIPEISSETGRDVAMKFSGICLETNGDDELCLAFA